MKRRCGKCGKKKPEAQFGHRSKGVFRGQCKGCHNAVNETWRRGHPERVRGYKNRARRRLKAEVLFWYGSVCSCCGEGQQEFLTIDHVGGDGARHRREIGVGTGTHFYHWLKNNDFPPGFQVLCFNCNCAKGLVGYCPHEK